MYRFNVHGKPAEYKIQFGRFCILTDSIMTIYPQKSSITFKKRNFLIKDKICYVIQIEFWLIVSNSEYIIFLKLGE